MATFELPLVDFGGFIQGGPIAQKQIAEELIQSFEKHGFVRLKGHGISKDFIDEIWNKNRLFFELPERKKMEIMHVPSGDPQRGWSRKGLETTSKLRRENLEGAPSGVTELLDEKEHFDCGPPGDQEFPNKFLPNEVLPGYQKFMESYFELMQSVSLEILRAFELGYDIPPGSLTNRCKPAASELRTLHYPPVPAERLRTGTLKRAWPHTDFGIITLLFQDSVGGLECEDRRHPFTFAPILSEDKYEMIVNSSETLTRWTNGKIRAGMHQVNVPPTMRDQEEGIIPERFSSAFFFKAHRDVSVGPLGCFVSANHPAAFEEISALELHREMTKIIY